MLDNDASIPLPCPGCGQKTTKTVGWFRAKPDSFVCSGCGKTVQLNDDEVSQVAKVFDDLDDSLGRLADTFDGFG